MSVGGLLILCLVGLAVADLRMASQPKNGFELVNQGSTHWNIQNNGEDMHFRYMEPATFGYKGLENQKKRNYDNFLRSNIDNEQDNRNFDDEDGKDHLPFRTYESEVNDTYWWYRGNRNGIDQPPMKVDVSRAINPGESMLVPLRWNNPHASEMEVNIWIFEHAGKHPVVVPIRKPSCSGEGHQDNVISFTVPKDFDTLGAKIPGFKGCNADSRPQCTLQIYSHSVESRTYAIGFPIVIPRLNTSSDVDSGSKDNSSIQKASEDPWLELKALRDICLPATDPSATITSAVPRWARLVSDVYNHAYQNSDYSPYSGQQHEGISKNLQASAINKMVASNRGELGKAILPRETYDRLRYLRGLENKIYKNYEALANKVINTLWPSTPSVGVDPKVQNLATCFRCTEVGSTNSERLQTNTYIPSFQLPKDLVPRAKQIVGTEYAKLISDSGLVQIYVASLNDLLPFFYKARHLGIIYQPAVVKSTIGTMPDARNFKKRNGENKPDGGVDAATLAKQKLASVLNCPTKCLDFNSEASIGVKEEVFYKISGMRVLPDLSKRTPSSSRQVLQPYYANTGSNWPGFSERDNFAVRWTGALYIEKAGDYTFMTYSDDGSRMFIDDSRVVDNDGLHGWQGRSGTKNMTAGRHAFKAEMFERGGSAGIEVKYQGPDTQDSMERIPSSAFAEDALGNRVSFEKPLIKGALATNTTGECHPCVQFFGKEVHPVTEPDVTPLAKDIMGDHVPKNMGANNLEDNPDNRPHVGDVKMTLSEMSRTPTSMRRRRRRSAFIHKHEPNM